MWREVKWSVIALLLVCSPSIWLSVVLVCTVYSFTKNLKDVLFSSLFLTLGMILSQNVVWTTYVFEVVLVVWSLLIVRSVSKESEGFGRATLYSFIVLWVLNFSVINELDNVLVILSVMYVAYFILVALFSYVFQTMTDVD